MVEGPSGGGGGNGSAGGQIGEILAVGTRAAGSGRVTLATDARPGEPTLRWRSRARTIEQIEAELSRIWSEPNLEALVEGEPGRHIAARTSVMNLVVIARRPEVGERCAATIQQLTGRHPSRTLILGVADPDGPSWLDAHIQAHCILPREGSAETCAETIYLNAGGESGRHLDSIVAPLLIHDLPAIVWWPGDPPLGTEPAKDLLAMATRLVVDGSSWSEDGLTRLGRLAELLASAELSIRDFAFLRQSRWREAIASIFDMPEFLPFIGSVRRIAVAYATHDETEVFGTTNLVKPIYHVSWLGSRLGMRVVSPLGTLARRSQSGRGISGALGQGRGQVAVVIRPVRSDMPAGTTLRVELLAERRGSELRADVTAEKSVVRVRVWLDGIESLDRSFPAPRRNDVELLAEAIEASGRDRVEDESLAFAAELIGEDPGGKGNR